MPHGSQEYLNLQMCIHCISGAHVHHITIHVHVRTIFFNSLYLAVLIHSVTKHAYDDQA